MFTCAYMNLHVHHSIYYPQPPVMADFISAYPPGFNPQVHEMAVVSFPAPNAEYLPTYDDAVYLPIGC